MGVTTYTRNVVSVGVDSGVDSTASVCIVALVAVAGFFEVQRRAAVGSWSPWSVARPLHSAKNCKRVLLQPEVLGFLGCLGFVAVLLSRTSTIGAPEDEAMWEQIKAEWPRLLCADTLLGIQAMLRLVVLASAVFHGSAAGPVPLAPESATLLGLGCIARVTVSAQSAAYLLDGPLGANLPVACDVLSAVLALSLGRACFLKKLVPTASTAIALTWLSSRHCMNLSGGQPYLDALFIASYGFDSLAALTHLFQSLTIGSAAAALPRQAIFAVQAMIGAYYFHYALPHNQEIVLAGKPLEFLELIHTAAAAACLGAMALFLVDDTPLPSSGDFGDDCGADSSDHPRSLSSVNVPEPIAAGVRTGASAGQMIL